MKAGIAFPEGQDGAWPRRMTCSSLAQGHRHGHAALRHQWAIQH